LAGITFDDFDASRSIVNRSFKNHPIWIGNPDNPKKLHDLQKQPFLKIHKSFQVGKAEGSIKQYQTIKFDFFRRNIHNVSQILIMNTALQKNNSTIQQFINSSIQSFIET
jgi:hypothetical protein